MHILVTNDDGVQHPGILALAQAMRELGDVTVLAPDKNWSASGHVKTLTRPLRVRSTQLADGSPALATDGAPSDCVALALLGLLPDTVDLVISGINPHANLGHDVTYSGTVTAAMEAVIGGVPGIAFSLDSPKDHQGPLDFSSAGAVAKKIVSKAIQQGIGKKTLLSVNIPYLPESEIKGIQITRQGTRIYLDKLVTREDPQGRPYYWIGGEYPTALPLNGTDFGAISSGYVSITPLQLDLTDDQLRDEIETWDWE